MRTVAVRITPNTIARSKTKGKYVYTIILTILNIFSKRLAHQLAFHWHDSHNYAKWTAGSEFDDTHDVFPRCAEPYCHWQVVPGYPHHACDELLTTMAADEAAEWEQFKADEEAAMAAFWMIMEADNASHILSGDYNRDDYAFAASDSDDEDDDDQQDLRQEIWADQCSLDNHQFCIGGSFGGHWANLRYSFDTEGYDFDDHDTAHTGSVKTRPKPKHRRNKRRRARIC